MTVYTEEAMDRIVENFTRELHFAGLTTKQYILVNEALAKCIEFEREKRY